jgi:uncharacterized Fe-S cluster protein YjdI
MDISAIVGLIETKTAAKQGGSTMADLQTYETEAIRVTYDPQICTHAAKCVSGLPAVFDANARPWVRPGNADPNAVSEQVKRCPSGALQYEFLKQAN